MRLFYSVIRLAKLTVWFAQDGAAGAADHHTGIQVDVAGARQLHPLAHLGGGLRLRAHLPHRGEPSQLFCASDS